ncbi:hypothetical protein TNCV_4298451 [Trichonephila clavipes]|nr:hypothetical protein TNCV_4298451 [Trichonephila clavipes]
MDPVLPIQGDGTESTIEFPAFVEKNEWVFNESTRLKNSDFSSEQKKCKYLHVSREKAKAAEILQCAPSHQRPTGKRSNGLRSTRETEEEGIRSPRGKADFGTVKIAKEHGGFGASELTQTR